MQDDTYAQDSDGDAGDDAARATAAGGFTPAEPAPQDAGGMLRAARLEQGLDLSQVAAETRIPQRHLVSIEAGEYQNLPSRTYAIGFSRTYARMLDLDEKTVLDRVRAELASDERRGAIAPAKFEPGDPARVPSRKLAWLGALAALLLLVGGFAFYRTYFAPGLGPAPLQEDRQVAEVQGNAPQPAAATPRVAAGPVVFTSEMADTWVKFYDASGEELYQAQMAEGESFTVPADAEGPQVWTGRPYALAITVGGKPVPKLSEEDEILRDVPVSAEALLARAASVAPTASPAPAAGATPAGTPIAGQRSGPTGR